MKREKNILTISLIVNLLITVLKFVSGIIFNFSSLIADSLHSFSDFVTDIISSFANKYGKKRANKKYPFGYGMIENLSNLFIGITLFVLAVFILIESFQTKDIVLNINIIFILVFVIVVKLTMVMILYHNGNKTKSNILITSAKESLMDVVSSIIVLIVSILLLLKGTFPILKYADSVGSIIISIIIFYTSIKIIVENTQYLLGKADNNPDLDEEVKQILKSYSKVHDYTTTFIKIGNYYKLNLKLEIDPNINLKQLFRLENKIKKDLKKIKFKIKFIEIEIIPFIA